MTSLNPYYCLLFFTGSYAAVASVPGPNFLVVSRASLQSRRTGTAAALGVATGATLSATLTVVTLGFFEQMNPVADFSQVRLVLSLAYGALLLKAGISGLIDFFRTGHGAAALPGALRPDIAAAFRLGVFTACSNPMSLAFFVSACGMLVTGIGARGALASPALVFLVALAWFGLIGLLLSAHATRRYYQRIRAISDAAIGMLLIVSGSWAIVRTLLLQAG